MVVYLSVRRERCSPWAKHTGQRGVVRSFVLGHGSRASKIRELVASRVGLILDALCSRPVSISVYYLHLSVLYLPIGEILGELCVRDRVVSVRCT